MTNLFYINSFISGFTGGMIGAAIFLITLAIVMKYSK